MPDIRDRVEEDRGLLKRIQLHLPGFAGYRRREDLRQADSILRIQVANRLKDGRALLEAARSTLAANYEMRALEPLGRAILAAQELEGMVRHAEQGYSGFSWAIRVEEPELDRLYEYDLALLDGVRRLEELARGLPGNPAGVAECAALVEELRLAFKRRMAVITDTEVR